MDRFLLNFKKKIEAAGKRQGWIGCSSMLVAVSGGGDSVALLWMLKEFYRGSIVVAHLDHCTRNGASHQDAEFVKELCKSWNLDCIVETVDVHNKTQQGESFEMAGRRVRYEFFENVSKRMHLDFTALGHNMDDLVETQLLNLFRGTGIAGLRGIAETRGQIVRPLIDFRREELRELLRTQNIQWREDETNHQNLYKRNKIRNQLIPWIKENLNGQFEISMAGLAAEAAEYVSRKNAEAEKNMSEIVTENEYLASWNARGIRDFEDNKVADMLRLQGVKLSLPVLDRHRTQELVRLIKQAGRWRFQWAGDIEVCRFNGKIVWLKRADAERLFHKE